jgi:hypothetical protein
MKATLFVILFSLSVFAQDQSAIATAEAACGPKEIKFNAKQDATQHPTPQPEPGKAVIYVVEDLGQCPGCVAHTNEFFTSVSEALTKVGMDGAWVGSNRGSSYIAFSVDPGEHHLCTNWQSSLESRSHAFAMANFTAQEGKIYYFRERVFPGYGDYSFDLDPVNGDEGKYLIAISPLSVWQAKK